MLFDKDYLAHPGISQSEITLFERDIRGYYNQKILGVQREETTSDPMDIGNIVDAKLLQPEMLKNYYVVTDMKATGRLKDIIDLFVDYIKAEKDSVFPEWPADMPVLKAKEKLSVNYPWWIEKYEHVIFILDKIILATEYQPNWGAETRLIKVITLGKDYYTQLLECGDRIMVGLEQWNKAHSKVDAVAEDEYTSRLFADLFDPSDPDITVHKQVPLYGSFEGVEIKGMLDFFIANKRTNTITPWDLKTAGSHQRFSTNYRAKRYGRQGAVYSELLRQNFPGYTILPFSFLVIPIETDERPEVYEMDATELYINENGHLAENGYKTKGWKDIVRELQWHNKTGKWDHYKEYYAAGKNIINSRFIIEADLLQVEEVKPLL